MYGSGPLDGDDDVNYKPPSLSSIPSIEEQRKMVEKRRKADKKLREKVRKKRERDEKKENFKRSIGRGIDGVKSFFSGNNRSSRPTRGYPVGFNSLQPVSAVMLDKNRGYHLTASAGGGKRKRKRNRTARKPKKRSKRTRRQKR